MSRYLAVMMLVVGTGAASAQPAALGTIRVKDGFRVEQLYAIPKDTQGSWVSMTVDPKGRLITSDQYGKLYRVTLGVDEGKPKVEPIPVDVGEAHGLLWAFDSLYVVVNQSGGKAVSGLYRVRDTDNDDQLDEVKLLRKIVGKGEHGPHAVLLGPDNKSIYVLAGNHTPLTKVDTSRVPQVWQEDQLLPRMWDARGHARGILAPGGWIAKTDPEGKEWELLCNGFRNEYDAAFNRAGELFTYDSDMEWDMNTPWYRPTRVLHCTSGAEFGWRSGTGKWPSYYPDSLPATVDIGPGSPTGVAFGYGAKFPAKYQEALFVCDWSYGKLYAVHLTPKGSTYKGVAEEFMTGTPLPLTDLIVHPKDGAMYFTTGGRKTTSGLYRLTYVGKESTAPAKLDQTGADARAIRHQLETYHLKQDAKAIDVIWPHLSSKDRFIRYAARVALEHQDPKTWLTRAFNERNPQASLMVLLALTRMGEKDLQPRIVEALGRLDFGSLSLQEKLAMLRVYSLAFTRLAPPDAATAKKLGARLTAFYPAKPLPLNVELCKLLVYLETPGTAAKTMQLLRRALTQEEQMDYVLALRNLKTGWTEPLRQEYFRWFLKAAHYKGGASFNGFVNNIKKEAVAKLSPDEKKALTKILTAKPPAVEVAIPPRPFVKQWTLEELTPKLETGLKKRDYDKGRRLFAETSCFSCHRFDNEGGATGPDLSGIAGRFSPRDLLESLIDPSKEISDQYQAVIIQTKDDQIITGKIVNLSNDVMMVMKDMTDPNSIERIKRDQVEEMTASPVSMMPKGLLDTLKEDEILDLMAFLLSRGDRNSPMFQ